MLFARVPYDTQHETFDAFAVDVTEAQQHDNLVMDTFWELNTDGEEEDKSVSEASSAKCGQCVQSLVQSVSMTKQNICIPAQAVVHDHLFL